MRQITVEELVAENTVHRTRWRWIEQTLQEISLETGHLRLVDTTIPLPIRVDYLKQVIKSAKCKGVEEELLRLGSNPPELASLIRKDPGDKPEFAYFIQQIHAHAHIFGRMADIALKVEGEDDNRKEK